MERRKFFKIGSGLAAGSLITPPYIFAEHLYRLEEYFPVRQLTINCNYHWFGYYDKLQADSSGRYLLGMEVPFEMRSPDAKDEVIIGMVDIKENDRWIELGTIKSWGWQQGCMLQWIPGSSEEIIWNDREDNHFISRILCFFK